MGGLDSLGFAATEGAFGKAWPSLVQSVQIIALERDSFEAGRGYSWLVLAAPIGDCLLAMEVFLKKVNFVEREGGEKLIRGSWHACC